MDQIRSLHDLLQTFYTCLGRFQVLRFRDPNKVAIREPLEYIEHGDLLPPAWVMCTFSAKYRTRCFFSRISDLESSPVEARSSGV
jgi:hypothetical protein